MCRYLGMAAAGRTNKTSIHDPNEDATKLLTAMCQRGETDPRIGFPLPLTTARPTVNLNDFAMAIGRDK